MKFSNQKTKWLIGLKSKTHKYAFYKTFTLDLKIHTLKLGNRKHYSRRKTKKTRVVIVKRQNRLQNNSKRQRQSKTWHNDKRINPTRRYNNCKYTQAPKSTPIYLKQFINKH